MISDWSADSELSIVATQPNPQAAHVQIAGEIDLASAPQLQAALLDVMADAPAGSHISVDLTMVTFIDATGVGVLLKVREASRRARIGFSLYNPCGIVRLVLDVLDLTDVLCAVPAPPGVPDVAGPDVAGPDVASMARKQARP